MSQLQLWFTRDSSTQLYKTSFFDPSSDRTFVSVRGKTSGALADAGTFQWTPAVKALCLLILRTVGSKEANDDLGISGYEGSPAASLGFALSRQTEWISDMFGVDESGRPNLKKLLLCNNPERKQSGPTVIALNTKRIPIKGITLFLNEKQLALGEEILAIAQEIELMWKSQSAKIKQHALSRESDQPIPHQSQSFFENFREAYGREVFCCVSDVSTFSKRGLKARADFFRKNSYLNYIAPHGRNIFDHLNDEFTASDWVGGGLDRKQVRALLEPLGTIRCAASAPVASCHAIFSHMRDFGKFNLEIDFRTVHTLEISSKLLRGDYFHEPDLFVLGVPAAFHLSGDLARRKKPFPYKAVMLMPATTQRICASAEATARVPKSPSFLFFSDLPSLPLYYYNLLREAGTFGKSPERIDHIEPHETVRSLSANQEARMIAWFPFFEFSRLSNAAVILDDEPIKNRELETVLFMHERIADNSVQRRALLAAIRDAWLDLRDSLSIRRQVVAEMLENGEYVKFLARSGGISPELLNAHYPIAEAV